MVGDETNPNWSWEAMDLTSTFEIMAEDDSYLIVPDENYDNNVRKNIRSYRHNLFDYID